MKGNIRKNMKKKREERDEERHKKRHDRRHGRNEGKWRARFFGKGTRLGKIAGFALIFSFIWLADVEVLGTGVSRYH